MRITARASALAILCVSSVLPVLATGGSASAAPDPARLGSTAEQAAASCWEIKQGNPSSPSGVYWLLTPRMAAPQQFYCDQATDGGGWVLVGKGRDGWTTEYDGKGAASALTSPDTSPMSNATVQLASGKVDALLNGQRVDALTDGVRLRRATNAAGTTWQEVRFDYSNRDRWVWTFGAEHYLSSYSFDKVSRTGGQTVNFGTDNLYNRVYNTPVRAQGFRQGFAFGSSVTGTSASSTFLYSQAGSTGYALPYTQVYLRPQVRSTDAGFAQIGDSGTSASSSPAVANSNADALPWHVSGLAGSTAAEGNVEVQAFTQSGSRMYVGGNFRYAQRAAASTGVDQVSQPFLAAFDVSTGELVQTFRPVLNEQVRALATLPNGSVLAGGDFTVVNGSTVTNVVALDPTTGATDASFNLKLENRLTGGVLRVNALKVANNEVYLAGAFTHLSGGTKPATAVYSRSGAIAAVDGTPRADWKAGLNGTATALDVSADGKRVYFAGYFTQSGTTPTSKVAVFHTGLNGGLASTTWNPTWSASANYQQAIDEVGSRVWVGGSEHSMFSFDTTSFARLSGNIMKAHGDLQSVTNDGKAVYAGCHCQNFNYTNAYTWPNVGSGFTQADSLNWVGAWNASTGQVIPNFVPTMAMRAESGIWAMTVDSNGRLWAGGDILTAKTATATNAWSGGFTRFSPADSTPPTTPSGLRVTAQTATTATLSWVGSTDARPISYQVLRDDRVVATTGARTLTVPLGGRNRFFVRAADDKGNVSASTPVVTVAAAAPVA
ncbi:MAG TPA: fibrinogen-like YCDxxxxGGGW domain-containing protein [Nocardioidaceae bacterium]|nr:fibrinogen-like YCDxxxxGGGW domain-containing protein [Nocardioidaceae bacterium]